MYRQVADIICERIRGSVFPGGCKLPPERELAVLFGVSRTTAINAYRHLEKQGMVVTRVGSGTYVAQAPAGQPQDEFGVPWMQVMTPIPQIPLPTVLRDILEASTSGGGISLAAGMPDPQLYPVDSLPQFFTATHGGVNPQDLGHIATQGYGPLRQTLGKVLADRGVTTTPDDVMITAGSQQGLYLLAKALLEPGDYVVVESPTYIGAHQVFNASGARILGLPATGQFPFGLLEDYLIRYRPKILYVIPTYHNPTGRVLSQAERLEVLRLAARHRLVVVEDDPYSELHYGAKPPPPLKAMDTYDCVVYLSTFSKVLFPGLRTGYLVAHPALLNRMALEKQFVDLHTNNMVQWLLCELLEGGGLESHLAMIRGEYRSRRDALAKALRRYLGDDLSFSTPEGGFYLWCRIKRPVSASRLLQEASGEGVSFVPGEAFYVSPPEGERDLRLCFAANSEERLREGARRLGRALASVSATSKAPKAIGEKGTRPIV
jgi:DNA-binding transcriptional MocR family regulator